MINYPKALTCWPNHTPLLIHSVTKFLQGETVFDEQELNSIKGYIKHWIEFDGHQFEDESDREFLLRELESCKNVGSLNLVIDNLLDFGIDPF